MADISSKTMNVSSSANGLLSKRAGVGDHYSPIILRAPLYINLLVTSALRAVCPQASLKTLFNVAWYLVKNKLAINMHA